jgi:transposase-like protein
MAGKRNSRNGYSKKTVLTETSKLDLRIPRDREETRTRRPRMESLPGFKCQTRSTSLFE